MAKLRWLIWGLICSLIVFVFMYLFVYLPYTPITLNRVFSLNLLPITIFISLILGFIIGGIIVILVRRKEIK